MNIFDHINNPQKHKKIYDVKLICNEKMAYIE